MREQGPLGHLMHRQLSVVAGLLDFMTSEEFVAAIVVLCSRDLPAEQGTTDVVGMGGPGYFMAESAGGDGPCAGDGSQRAETAEQFMEERDDIARLLTLLWGVGEYLGTQTIRLRPAMYDEVIPEPWLSFSQRVDDMYLWEVKEHRRWVAVGIADRDEADEVKLLAVVTDIDPP
jgi:hypothetical protein